MYIDVRLLSGFPKPLLYRAPSIWQNLAKGTIVNVPMRNAIVPAFVLKTHTTDPKVAFKVREAESIEAFPEDKNYYTFIEKLAQYHVIEEISFIRRIHSFIKQNNTLELPEQKKSEQHTEVQLTNEQQSVVDFLSPKITEQVYTPTLLHGVTGSGKTEVYKKLILQAFKEKKSALLLLPEVSLAVQFERLLRAQLPIEIPIVSFHSATSAKTKKLLWKYALEGYPQLILGVHLPVLLPLSNLGVIIIDEEHESGFQEKKHPKLNTKHAALLRAQLYKVPIVLGSATPSITSLYNVKHRGWKLFQLKKRFAGAFPVIQKVLLTDKKQRKCFWISDQLKSAITDRLQKKEQSLVFLNRRGVCFFLQCKSCSHIFNCRSCSVSLTLHADDYLKCHYCSYSELKPTSCPECQKTEFLKKGIGTQQLVTILQRMFPSARIARADMDTTVNKKLWQQIITQFENQELDILVGTQTITKGYHFPNVTLVGVIWGDINLNFPFYNGQETVLQQLIQVAGRAGRQRPDSKVIVQTMTNHPVFNYLTETDYLKFYQKEIEQRRLVNYPPMARLAEIEIKHAKEETTEQEAFTIAAQLLKLRTVTVLGPTEPPVSKVKKVFSKKIYLKAQDFSALIKAFKSIKQSDFRSSVFFTPHPLN
ncbi:MAG: primosomal protein N' (replication factor Y) [Alteromonas naphthalenivorans]|jgi:primosomal protein N' (replication factor Y)